MKSIEIGEWKIGSGEPLTVICGPCVIESEEHTMRCAEWLSKCFRKRKIHFIFKASYDKANRSSLSSYRGPGLLEGLRILEKVRKEFDIPVVTDAHSPEEALSVGQVCDMVQIPAFLCRQTDLLVAAGRSEAVVSVKKGQFMAPWDMKNVIEKIEAQDNHNILLMERGFSFGYNNLVSDMRAIPLMQELGYPVCFDATHSVQLPGGKGKTSGGQREFIGVLAKAAVAAGANALFLEAHPEPSKAKSDSDSVLSFKELPRLVDKLKELYQVVNT